MNGNVTIFCTDRSTILSYRQYRWLLLFADTVLRMPDLVYAPEGNNKRVKFRGLLQELEDFLETHKKQISDLRIEDYHDDLYPGKPGRILVAFRNPHSSETPHTIRMPIQLLEDYKKLAGDHKFEKYTSALGEVPYAPHNPRGFFLLMKRNGYPDLPEGIGELRARQGKVSGLGPWFELPEYPDKPKPKPVPAPEPSTPRIKDWSDRELLEKLWYRVGFILREVKK